MVFKPICQKKQSGVHPFYRSHKEHKESLAQVKNTLSCQDLVIHIFLPIDPNLEKNEASKTYFQNTSLTSRIWICTLQYGSNLNSYQILKYRKKKLV